MHKGMHHGVRPHLPLKRACRYSFFGLGLSTYVQPPFPYLWHVDTIVCCSGTNLTQGR